MRTRNNWKALVSNASLAAALLLASTAAAQNGTSTLVLTGARLIDGTGRTPIENSTLVIEGGKIRAAGKTGQVSTPKGARVIRLSGKTVMPLLIDLHCHLGQTRDGIEQSGTTYTEANIRSQLEKFLAYGVGAILSLGTDEDLIY